MCAAENTKKQILMNLIKFYGKGTQMTASLCLLRFTKVDCRQVRINVYQVFSPCYIRGFTSVEKPSPP